MMEPDFIGPFRRWLEENGAYIHSSIRFVKDDFGTSVYASEDIAENSRIISCPFSIAITPVTSKRAFASFVKPHSVSTSSDLLDEMSERQLLCLYIIAHWILKEHGELLGVKEGSFNHLPYLDTLPSLTALRTPLHFNELELEVLRGTNLYGATLDRKKEWEAEWAQARRCIAAFRLDWHDEFTWERYLTASTYISSRAFPSTLLSSNPSLIATESSYPVLLPGVDSLNHLRGHPVSWSIDSCSQTKPLEDTLPLQVTLVVHPKTSERQEVFNNYGPKPNSELILGYGFSIANNSDDTIVLKIGGASGSGRGWEIGRHAKGIQGLWEEIQTILRDDIGDEEGGMSEADVCLEAADMLENMIQRKIESLPVLPDKPPTGVRKEVFTMVRHYLEGQRDILNSVLYFAQTEQEKALAEEE